jgi:hypothetical protein
MTTRAAARSVSALTFLALLPGLASARGAAGEVRTGAGGPQAPEIVVAHPDGTDPARSFGDGMRNCFASREAAIERRRRFANAKGDVTVSEFLGGGIDSVAITSFDRRVHTAKSAVEAVRGWLAAVLFEAPLETWAGPQLAPSWSEPVLVTVQGVLRYAPEPDDPVFALYGGKLPEGVYSSRDCRGDFQLGGNDHFVVRDRNGVFWWHRWDASFPRREVDR